MADPPRYADLVNDTIQAAIPSAHRMGVRTLEVRPGFAAAHVPLAGNGNHFGAMYAGALFTVGEILGGAIGVATFDATAFYPLAKDVQITFLKPARTDVRAEAALAEEDIARIGAEAAAHGKADFVLEAELTDADGIVVARLRGHYQLRAHGR